MKETIRCKLFEQHIVTNEKSLLNRLLEYGESGNYPFHMPGHKRRLWAEDWGNPIAMDITEIDGFDNLHAPEGILKESMEMASAYYGSDKTYYLVNGSTCGILSAICACTTLDGMVLMARNCHKSAYHGVYLNRLKVGYLYPQWIEGFGMDGGYLLETVAGEVEKHPDAQAVLLVSPTYEGVVSDIRPIAEYLHGRGIPLIVDEAHGAHFPFGTQGYFPKSALEEGADVVIQSLHKTLPSPTQTAVLHVKSRLVDRERLERYLHIYQSSSPSYLLLAGIDRCVRGMIGEGQGLMDAYEKRLAEFRQWAAGLSHIRLFGAEEIGRNGVFDMDRSKLVLSVQNTDWSGKKLMDALRDEYHLELEMSAPTYALAMTTVADSEEGFLRLKEALSQLDKKLCAKEQDLSFCQKKIRLQQERTIAGALDEKKERVRWEDCSGRIAAETIFVYPPGIPIMVPGERITREAVEAVAAYKSLGYPVLGMADESGQTVACLE